MDQSSSLKQCKKCLKFFPATPEYFRVVLKTGALWSPCKECVSARHKEKMKDAEFRKQKAEYDLQWHRENQEILTNRCRQKCLSDPEYHQKRRNSYKKYNAKEENKEKRREYQRTSSKNHFGVYKRGAKSRNLVFNLTFEEFMTFWQQPCFYCGDSIETVGLDRINNAKGYELHNLVPCCYRCNWSKSNQSIESWLNFIKQISQHFEKIQQKLMQHQ